VPATWHGAPSTLPVIDTRGGWDDVRLAPRPNESRHGSWPVTSTLATTPYRIVVDLSTTHLLLYRANRLVFSAPAGIGTPADPTPTGHFFVAFPVDIVA
jgi:L,D-transpeptidase catalytic domain